MIEVEAKVKISSPGKFREKIKKLARYVGRQKKTDNYYALGAARVRPKHSLRIRERGRVHEVNFKQSISYSGGVHAKKESEFTVSNVDDFLGLIQDFGFKRWIKKEKTSEVYEIKKNFRIEINFVKHLGWFLEVEYLVHENKIAKAREAVIEVLDKLGVSKKDIVKSGYTLQLWKKGKHF